MEERNNTFWTIPVESLFRQMESSADGLSNQEAKKRLLRKQELFLIKEGAANRINPTMAIFRLKQPVFGYTDKQDIKIDANVTFVDDL